MNIEKVHTIQDQGIKVYPNPFSNTLTFEMYGKGSYIVVYDIFGKVIVEKQVKTNKFTLSTDNWPAGVYLIKVTESVDTSHIFKVFKTK